MSTTTIKMPRYVVEVANIAHELGMKAGDLMGELHRIFGDRWLKKGQDLSFSVTTLGIQESGEVVAPLGYELAEGCTDVYVGPETVSSAFVVRPSWHAGAGLFSVEITPADGLGDFQALAPEEALKLAADIKTVTESICPVNVTAADTASV